MNKRTVLFLVSLFIFVVLCTYIFLYRQTFQDRVTVPYTMLKTGEQLNNIFNLSKWYYPIAGKDSLELLPSSIAPKQIKGDGYSVEYLDGSHISVVLKSSLQDNSKEFHFVVSPDSNNMKSSIVTLRYQATLGSKWFGSNELIKNAHQSLANLKEYMEDTRRLYGYEIQIIPVNDTSFLFLSETVPDTTETEATKRIFNLLIEYARKMDAGYNGVRIFHTQKAGSNIMLFASIGITRKLNPEEPFQYKQMPFGKNLLEATYQGPYGEIERAYKALEDFKKDHELISMAIPFQKFLSEGYGFPKDQIVQMKVYYPIF